MSLLIVLAQTDEQVFDEDRDGRVSNWVTIDLAVCDGVLCASVEDLSEQPSEVVLRRCPLLLSSLLLVASWWVCRGSVAGHYG